MSKFLIMLILNVASLILLLELHILQNIYFLDLYKKSMCALTSSLNHFIVPLKIFTPFIEELIERVANRPS